MYAAARLSSAEPFPLLLDCRMRETKRAGYSVRRKVLRRGDFRTRVRKIPAGGRETNPPTSASYRVDVDLRSFTPEHLQVVNACHLVRSKIQTMQPRLAQVLLNKFRQLACTFLDGLFER